MTDVSKLLQPHLLSRQELVQILKTCRIKDADSMSLTQLLDVYHRVALPLPQRQFTESTWRERLLAKKQKLFEAHKTNQRSGKTSPTKKTAIVKQEPSKSLEKRGDRLKPPPDLINYEHKKIKLSSSSSHSSDIDKIIIKDRTKESNSRIIINDRTKRKSSDLDRIHINDKRKKSQSTDLDKIIINDRRRPPEDKTNCDPIKLNRSSTTDCEEKSVVDSKKLRT